MFSKLFRRRSPVPCPRCGGGDLIQQAKKQIVDGQHIGAIASARCHVARRLWSACNDLQLFKNGRQKRRPNLASMAWRLHEAGAIDQQTYKRFNAFGRTTAAVVDGGPLYAGVRAWKAINVASQLVHELSRQLSHYRPDEVLAAKGDQPTTPDESANF